MIDYEFFKAPSLKEALEFLGSHEGVKAIAGGTDLLVDIRKENARAKGFKYLLDISGLKELKFIEERKDCVAIGALSTHTMLVESLVINKHFPLLASAAKTIGSTQIRNRGTVGGNINNASPAADLLPPLIALKAHVKLRTLNGERKLPLDEFLAGPYRTNRQSDEIMTEVCVPLLGEGYFTNFQKIGRRKAMNIARLNLAVVLGIKDDTVFDPRIVPGAATAYPIRFGKTEEAISGKRIGDIDPAEIGERASEEMISTTGIRWSTPYKRIALASLVKRALETIFREAKADE
ncbi:FAD binding domain-containing protein [Acetomicrobium hydrogeniformans]|uniref:Xanthine dehydrogenase family protein subunit M n=1 Tax=Acetomicrobium hydrogeniformans TaxID=649746 RepID=A0A7V6ZE58_9BACT|nr:xanthine dehydrogenase family protein subunit M [Acetomicrobium hydrogeniformans]HHZ04106.1 xanthine dehydrogenase family protein subunit M [Acetomicrobium hydrogeniformans]